MSCELQPKQNVISIQRCVFAKTPSVYCIILLFPHPFDYEDPQQTHLKIPCSLTMTTPAPSVV